MTSPYRSPEHRRSFWALMGAMFQGALSDNIYRLMLVMLLLGLAQTHAIRELGDGATEVQIAERATSIGAGYQAILGTMFMLPYVLVVSFAGWLSDRFPKHLVTQGTKVLEVAVMSAAMVTLFLGPTLLGENYVWVLVGILFFMGAQSALFSPSKYGIMPEIVHDHRVGWANGIMQGLTFIAIVVGTIAGPKLYGVFSESLGWAGAVLVLLSCVGLVISLIMRPVAAANPHEELQVNPFPMVWRYGSAIWGSTALTWAVLGSSIWWGVAMMLQNAAVQTANDVLRLPAELVGLALLPIVVGMGLGSFAVSLLCRQRIQLGLVVVGAVGMFVSCLIVWAAIPSAATLNAWRTDSPEFFQWYIYGLPVLMGLSGLTCGFFVTPLEAYIVQQSPSELRGGIWAVNAVINAGFMIAFTVVGGVVIAQSANTGTAFLAGGVVMLFTLSVLAWRFPQIVREVPLLLQRTPPGEATA